MDQYQLQRIGHIIDYKEMSVTHMPSYSEIYKPPYWKVKLIVLGTHKEISASGQTMADAFDHLEEKINELN